MIQEDIRAEIIYNWLDAELALNVQAMFPASSDASFRRYFRIITPDKSLIVMDAPLGRESLQSFIKVAGIMRDARVNVPAIHEFDLPRGLMLLEDFGSSCFLEQLTGENATRLYYDALDSLFSLQTNPDINKLDLPTYDAAFFERELNIFYEWFLTAFLNIDIPDGLKSSLNEVLINSALQQPQTCVHRDFHSRNLMYLENNNPGVIDFQDAVIGPVSYDLVSLLKDCYISWPDSRIDEWREYYLLLLQQKGLVDCTGDVFKRWFDLMGLQRHLKAIGIFSRLHLRDGKSGYLNDIPRTLDYVMQVAETYPELRDFQHFLENRIQPVYRNKKL